MRLTYLLSGVAPVAFLLGLVVNAQILRVQRGQDAVATLKNKHDLINRWIRQRHAISAVCSCNDYGNVVEGHLLLYLPCPPTVRIMEPLRFRFRFWRSICSGSGSESIQYLAQFSNIKKLYFSMSESWPLIFDLKFYSILCWIRIQIRSGTGFGTVTVMHSGSGSAKAKRYGSRVPG
jgi:hypothetical protein